MKMTTVGIFGWFFFWLLPAEASTLSGTVTRSDTHAPVEQAKISIRGTKLFTQSGSDGRYQFANVPNGVYGITCSAAGLVGVSTWAIDLEQNARRDFSLGPPPDGNTTLFGTISCDEIPCGNVLVFMRQDHEVRSADLSAADGSYRLEGLSDGTYEIAVTWLGYISVRQTQVISTTAEPTPVDFNLNSAGGTFAVEGSVGLSDNPLDRSLTTIRCNGQSPELSTTTSIGGGFRLENVPSGLLSFSAIREGYRSEHHIDVWVPTTGNVDFVLRNSDSDQIPDTHRFSGTVTLNLPQGQTVPEGTTRVSLWAVDGVYGETTTADPNGHYEITGIPSGSYLAGAAHEGFVSKVSDPLSLGADQTMDFTLDFDTVYDFGPGRDGLDPTCGCSAPGDKEISFCLLLLGLVYFRRKK
jgi:hypothetical protein